MAEDVHQQTRQYVRHVVTTMEGDPEILRGRLPLMRYILGALDEIAKVKAASGTAEWISAPDVIAELNRYREIFERQDDPEADTSVFFLHELAGYVVGQEYSKQTHTAADELAATIEKRDHYRKALQWYAEKTRYSGMDFGAAWQPEAYRDGGERAREALEQQEADHE